MTRLLPILLAALLLAGCATQDGLEPGASCGESSNMPLPVQRAGTAILVPVTANGVRLRFMLDTGGASSVIDRRVALALGLMHGDVTHTMVRDVAGERMVDQVAVQDLHLGSITLPPQRLIVSDGFAFDGVIGLDVLSRYDLDIDLAHNSVVLRNLGLCPDKTPLDLADLRARPATRMLTMPAIRGIIDGTRENHHAEPFLQVAARLDGEWGLAMFDTGALAGSLLSPKFTAKLKLGPEAFASDQAVTTRGLGPGTEVRLHRFGRLELGGEVFEAPTLLVTSDAGLRFPLILGSDYFLHHRVWFNFAANRVFVWPDATVAPMVPGS